MARSTKGKASKNYKRGKRVTIYVHRSDGHQQSIGSFTAVFWESDGTYLYYRETYSSKTQKIRWETVDNVVPVAQRAKVGIAVKGEDVRSAKAREISEAADVGNAMNTLVPVKVTRRKLTPEEVVFALDELLAGTRVVDVAEVLEVGNQSVYNWHSRIHGEPDQYETGWFKLHSNDAIGVWFTKMWTRENAEEPEQVVVRTGDDKLMPLSGAVLDQVQARAPDPDPLIEALESRIEAARATLEQKVGEYVANGREIEELARLRSVIDAEITALKRNFAHYTLMLENEYEIQSGHKESDDGTS